MLLTLCMRPGHPAGALLRSLNDDTAAYQQAVSERLGIFIQHMTTFVVGFAVAFWRGGWQAALVSAGSCTGVNVQQLRPLVGTTHSRCISIDAQPVQAQLHVHN
jgi:ABC-type multidrug transport system fused ATPase/permease subunit